MACGNRAANCFHEKNLPNVEEVETTKFFKMLTTSDTLRMARDDVNTTQN